jgi:Tol biopolymer transport system component
MKSRAHCAYVAGVAAVCTAWIPAVRAAPGDTFLVSAHYAPATIEQPLFTRAISGTGRFVLFESRSDAFVPPAGNSTGVINLLVRDRLGGGTTLASLSATGHPVGGSLADMSADGRYVAFQSYEEDVVSGDTNNVADIFLRDLQAGTTERISVSTTGQQYATSATDPDVSRDGRYVAFGVTGYAHLRDRLTRQTHERYVPGLTGPVLVSDDGGYLAYSNYERLLVHNRSAKTTELVNVNTAGQRANDQCYLADLSADARFVLFISRASNLVAGDTNDGYDVFVRDRTLRRTERVSVTSDGKPFPWIASYVRPRMSADGRYVVFTSTTRSIPAPGGTYNLAVYDVFRRDRAKGKTWLATANSAGVKANNTSNAPLVSDDGRFVAFASKATNLSAADGDSYQDAYVHQFSVAPL